MSENSEVVQNALLQWTKGVVTLFDKEVEESVSSVNDLQDIQNNNTLLCALKTILFHQEDNEHDEASFSSLFKSYVDASDSTSDTIKAIIGQLEVKYDHQFKAFDVESTLFTTTQMQKIVELTLGWAMLYGDDTQKTQYVEYIFSLKPDLQTALMMIIQEQQQQAFGNINHTIPDEEMNVERKIVATPPSKTKKSSTNHTTSILSSMVLSPFGASPVVNRRLSASAFGTDESPYQRLAASQSGKKRSRKYKTVQSPSTPSQMQNAIETLRSQLQMFKNENLKLHEDLSQANKKLAEREEAQAYLSEGSDKRAAELKKVMKAEMKVRHICRDKL